MKLFVNRFVDIALYFFVIIYLIDLYLKYHFLVYCQNLSFFFTKLAIPLLLAKLFCFHLEVKFSEVTLLNSCVVRYFYIVMSSSNFIFIFTNFCLIISFLTELLALVTLFSTAVRAIVVT